MLVLSRSPGESILIGDNIKVTVTQVRGDHVRLGIEAPENVKILRSEVPDRGKLPAEQCGTIEVGSE
jgi:carbon storage regulator